jgi:hypothetical protein
VLLQALRAQHKHTCSLMRGMLLQVDEGFRGVLAGISTDPLLRTFSEQPSIESTLASMLTQLECCQAALLEFLEAKRSEFPRCVPAAAGLTVPAAAGLTKAGAAAAAMHAHPQNTERDA